MASPRRLAHFVLVVFSALVAPALAGAADWRPLVTLPGPADRSAGFDVAAGPDGTVVAVWTKTTDGKSQVMQSVRPPGGEFTAPAPLGNPGGGFPRVAVDGQGNATAVWEQQVGNTALLTVLQSTRPAGGAFGTAEPLSSFTAESRFVDIAMNSRGDTLVTWTNRTTTEFIEATGRPAGGTFADAVPVSAATAAPAFDSKVAVGEDGSGMVVWEREVGFVQAAPWSASLNSFGSRFNVTAGDTAGEFGATPDVAVMPNGVSVFAYFGTKDGRAIKSKTRTNDVMSGATDIASLPTNNGSPTLVSNPAGDILAAWDSGSSVMRASFRPAGQGFQPAENLSGPLPSPKGFSPPSTALTAGGDAVVAWVAGPDGSERVQARTKPRNGGFSPIQDDFPVRSDVAGVAVFADGAGDRGTLSRRLGTGDPGTLELRPFDAAAPRASGLALPAGVVVGRTVPFSASFLDTWSPFSLSWSFGDGATASGSPVEHGYGAPGTFTATATAVDAAANASSQSGVVGVRALRPDEIDADGDGFTSDKDCNDGNPAVHPGALDIRQNGIDEDCVGGDRPLRVLRASISFRFTLFRTHTELDRYRAVQLEGGEGIRLRCRGRGCPFKAKKLKARKAGSRDMTKLVRDARFDAGTVLEAFITKGRTIGRYRKLKFRDAKSPKLRKSCVQPGAKKPSRCPRSG